MSASPVAVVAPASSSSVSPAASTAATSAAPRCAEHPSLFSLADPDPLSIVLSLCLTDLPAALGQSFFPKDLIRIVHEYALESVFVVEFDSLLGSLPMFHRVTIGSSTVDFVQWLGRMLPRALHPFAVADDGILGADDSPMFAAHCSSCLMDEEIRMRYGADISRLLHAQLQAHEYRWCYLEIPPSENGEAFTAHYAHVDLQLEQHDRFCLDELEMRKAAIVAQGQEPVAVGLHELLRRVCSAVEVGVLPRGLSVRPADWAPLFHWIRAFESALNHRRRRAWEDAEDDDLGDPDDCPAEPLLSAVMMQSPRTLEGAPLSHQTQARLWSHDKTQSSWFKAAASMMIGESDDEEEEAAEHQTNAASGSAASASSAPALPSSS